MQPNNPDKALLARMGYEAWSEMQEEATKAILAESEVLLLAPTGTGKTLGFLRAVLAELKADITGVQCLILVPSRELALQTEAVWKQMNTGFKVNSSYGGHDMPLEIQSLSTPPVLLVGTPGRINDHLNRKTFKTDSIRILILDEFDKSLALGFEEDMSGIMARLRKLQKKVLASATATVDIPDFVEIKAPKILDFINQPAEELLDLKLVRSEDKDKIHTLVQLLSWLGAESSLIFCNHREAVERTSQLLTEQGIEHAAFHGGLEQMEREQALVRFRNGSVYFLVATDLAARGLDIPEVRHVIHYHMPSTLGEFIHRNGRTARMKARGTAYLILHTEEPLPRYLDITPGTLLLPATPTLPKPSEWTTLFISGGRKDKLNKVDIVGFLSKVGGLEKGELGMIEVKDNVSFAAVKRSRVKELLQRIADEKMKGKKYKIALAR